MAGIPAGIVAGVVSNPVELVYTRMQVDAMYADGYRRNYRSFFHGLNKVIDEGVVFRGAAANGLKIAMLLSSMTTVYDFMKENCYFWLGPSWINRFVSTLVASLLGFATSMPFDTIRVRMHT